MVRAEPVWTSSDWPCEQALEQAVGYVAAVRAARGGTARLRAAASRPGLRAVLTLATELPVVEAPLSATPSGDELRSWFRPDRRLPFDRLPVALLRLPATQAEYLRGRARQALRTNVTRARTAGFTAAVVPVGPELRAGVEHVARLRRQDPATLVRTEGRDHLDRQFVLVHDAAGDPVALSEVVVDGDWAGLGALVIALGHADNQVMRYLLHAETTAGLIGRGVGSLTVAGSMLFTSPGTRYFQRRTGFQPVWLCPVARRPQPAVVPAAGPALPTPRTAADTDPVRARA
ncbi:hypothetical protein [Modestobacter sp. NPDC049651]|uniref:hypothetical protein n=1 Tax=unclassified Modestobacter TaxID=2643866 RepID=UPI0033FBAF55